VLSFLWILFGNINVISLADVCLEWSFFTNHIWRKWWTPSSHSKLTPLWSTHMYLELRGVLRVEYTLCMWQLALNWLGYLANVPPNPKVGQWTSKARLVRISFFICYKTTGCTNN
jgi:hypothetical protein